MKGLLLTFALCFGGSAAALAWPFLGLLAYVSFGIIRPLDLWFYSLPPLNYSRIISAGFLAGWCLHGFGNWRFGRARLIVWSLILFCGWTLVRTIGVKEPDLAWRFFNDIFKIVLPFVVGVTVVKTFREVRWLMWTIAVSQGYLALEFNQWYFSGYNRLWLDGFGSMDNNSNAIALVSCVGVCLFLGFGERRRILQAIAFVSLGLMVHAVLFSFSRGGMLALLITGGVAFAMLPKRTSVIALYAAGVIFAFSLAGDEVTRRFQTTFASEDERDTSSEGRLALWSTCVQIMFEHPLGLGAGQFPAHAPDYGFPYGKFAHSLWLQLGAELGFPGLALIVTFFGATLKRLWPLARGGTEPSDPLVPMAARMVIVSLAGFAVAAQFVSLYALEQPYYIALIGAATLKLVSTPESVTVVSPESVEPWRATGSWPAVRPGAGVRA
jgi:probable O-glycosylation ligase (exosortase A-associated)